MCHFLIENSAEWQQLKRHVQLQPQRKPSIYVRMLNQFNKTYNEADSGKHIYWPVRADSHHVTNLKSSKASFLPKYIDLLPCNLCQYHSDLPCIFHITTSSNK